MLKKSKFDTRDKIEWIFFDLDGTLINSINVMHSIYLEFLETFNIKGNLKEFQKLNGPSIIEIVIYLKNKYSLQTKLKNLVELYLQLVEESYLSKVMPFEGSNNILKLLKLKYKLALVTSNSKRIVAPFIKKYGWDQYFSIIVYGDEVKKSKPFPEIYSMCLKKSNAFKENVLVIEDSKNGVKSATNAGLRCILLKNNKKELDVILDYLLHEQ